ncbi:ABC transporter ATP-binding protein [Athalassotoga saccharophila]|uniref:ABC transporter ATP-binding protein n=1 Tax=Athalassotoga saccharophila TaxID=1441386 RepID=UPI0018D950D0|nr:ABC transporter ATP-binding protein [Athalassotoga saccharophila]BBJ28116.1 branched-chain amino acid transport ATP-binding protein LivF [Athalassotoga saccharophila]
METDHILEVENLTVKYGPIEAVKGTNFFVGNQEVVSILGANGAGKSSTLKALAGLIPHEGRVTFLSKDISRTEPYIIPYLGLTLCPERRGIFPDLSVEDNLLLGAYTIRKNKNLIKENIRKVYVLFQRLEERKRQLAGTLSGGEQQMLAIGRALMNDPKLLMLDEPSLGLSPKLVDFIFDSLKTINKSGTAILLVEQNAMIAMEISTRIYVMQNGKFAISGNTKDIDFQNLKMKYLGV